MKVKKKQNLLKFNKKKNVSLKVFICPLLIPIEFTGICKKREKSKGFFFLVILMITMFFFFLDFVDFRNKTLLDFREDFHNDKMCP